MMVAGHDLRAPILFLTMAVLGMFSGQASAQDIFAALPASAPFHGGIVVQIQQDYAIRAACGPDMPFGCITMLDQRTCVVHLWVGLPADLRTTAETNLRRMCANGG